MYHLTYTEKKPGPLINSQTKRNTVPAARLDISPVSNTPGLQQTGGNLAICRLRESFHAMLKVAYDPPPFKVDPNEVIGSLGKGHPLDTDTRRQLNDRFSRDFSDIRIYDNENANYISKIFNADALAVWNHIAFRKEKYKPDTVEGQKIIFHEAGHIARGSESGGSYSPQPVQLMVTTDDIDVREIMAGMRFIVRRTYGVPPDSIPEGAEVVIVEWGEGTTACVSYETSDDEILTDVPKLLLVPRTAGARDVRKYEVGLPQEQRAIEKSRQRETSQKSKIENWEKEKDRYIKNKSYWEELYINLEAELKGIQADLQKRERTLDKMLVMETMYNVFDQTISEWVSFYNNKFGPAQDLDPNIVKSLIFQESRMGISGEHLMLPSQPGYHQVKSRFNIGQAIDSAGMQQLLMLEEMAPEIYQKYHLDELAAQNRHKGMTNTDFDQWRDGEFLNALKEFWRSHDPEGKNLMGTFGQDLTLDYNFWIRTSIRWLFYKYFTLTNPSWPEAVRAYRGSGPAAEYYRQNIMMRTGSLQPLSVGRG